MKRLREGFAGVVACFAIFVVTMCLSLVQVVLPFVPSNTIKNARAINSNHPSVDSYISDADMSCQTPLVPDSGSDCGYINDQTSDLQGALLWQKVEPDTSNPGKYKPLGGAMFLLMATQANWNGTSSQQGSQMTITDCVTSGCSGSGDIDPRPGYFKVMRSSG
ncbi:MAG: hypothetical protein LBM13_05855, partial [Candidatus Ancillula sp.]|nr:hypothetical protein [Candidatus Ancillula sp.]